MKRTTMKLNIHQYEITSLIPNLMTITLVMIDF